VFIRLLNRFNREDVLARRVAKKIPRAGCGACCERGPRQTTSSRELVTVNVVRGASALVAILVSRVASCLETGSHFRGPSISRHARRWSQNFTVHDRPSVRSLIFSTFRICTCVLGPDFAVGLCTLFSRRLVPPRLETSFYALWTGEKN